MQCLQVQDTGESISWHGVSIPDMLPFQYPHMPPPLPVTGPYADGHGDHRPSIATQRRTLCLDYGKRVRREIEDNEKWMILTSVMDQSRPMEADIVPYLVCSGFYAFVRMVFRLFRNAMMSAVLYGPSVA